jgi:hypothetical protein
LFAVVSNGDDDTFKGQAGTVSDLIIKNARTRVHITEWIEVPGVADQYDKLEICENKVTQFEHTNGINFQWLIRLRTDGLYLPIPRNWLRTLNLSTVYQSSNSGDVLIVYPRETVRYFIDRKDAQCCGDYETRFFACGCEIVRTREASSSIMAIGLLRTSRLGNRRADANVPNYPLRHVFRPGTGFGVTEETLRLANATSTTPYTILATKPWSAG